jgi:hypothetical protein
MPREIMVEVQQNIVLLAFLSSQPRQRPVAIQTIRQLQE